MFNIIYVYVLIRAIPNLFGDGTDFSVNKLIFKNDLLFRLSVTCLLIMMQVCLF